MSLSGHRDADAGLPGLPTAGPADRRRGVEAANGCQLWPEFAADRPCAFCAAAVGSTMRRDRGLSQLQPPGRSRDRRCGPLKASVDRCSGCGDDADPCGAPSRRQSWSSRFDVEADRCSVSCGTCNEAGRVGWASVDWRLRARSSTRNDPAQWWSGRTAGPPPLAVVADRQTITSPPARDVLPGSGVACRVHP